MPVSAIFACFFLFGFANCPVAFAENEEAEMSYEEPVVADTLRTVDDGAYWIWSKTASGIIVGATGHGSSGSLIKTQSFTWSTSQLYNIRYISNGWYSISCVGSDLFLTTGNSIDGSNVYLSKWQNLYNQQWKIVRNSDGTFTFYPRNANNKVLDVYTGSTSPGAKIHLWSSNSTKAQKFDLVHWDIIDKADATGIKDVPTGYVTIASSKNSRYVLDVAANSMTDGANIQIYSSNSSFAQKWLITYKGHGLYTMQNAGSMKNLEVAYAGLNNGTNISQHYDTSSLNQMWYFEKHGTSYIVHSALNGKVMDISGARFANCSNVHLWDKNGTSAQDFTISWTDLIGAGTYTIQTAITKPMVLDITGASHSEYANVETWRSLGNSAQKFQISSLGGGQYSIKNPSSGKYLTADTTACGANVYQKSWNGSDRQRWIVGASGNNQVSFYNVASGRALDVASASRFRGANVHVWDSNGTSAQRFTLLSGNWSFYSGSCPAPIAEAERYEGRPYRWGGKSPATSFDCSGLVTYCANTAWHTRYDVWGTNASALYFKCRPISKTEARAGDLVFFQGTYGSNVNYISHVAFYCGNDTMYGAGDPIWYYDVNDVYNIRGVRANQLYARIIR